MNTDNKIKINQYFDSRKIDSNTYSNYQIPIYLKPYLPAKDAAILDIGCGLGQFLGKMKEEGFTNLLGIDISKESSESCTKKSIPFEEIDDIINFANKSNKKFDFVIMSHVLEHLEKEKIIDTLKSIRQNLISKEGYFYVQVPNAQSNTGCYWMYEDLTHSTLFTAGSIYYVLKSAGFTHIEFMDADGNAGRGFIGKSIISLLLWYYKKKQDFWNKVTQSSFHKPSPRIYSFELKVRAK